MKPSSTLRSNSARCRPPKSASRAIIEFHHSPATPRHCLFIAMTAHVTRAQCSLVRLRVEQWEFARGFSRGDVLEHQPLSVFRLIPHQKLGVLELQALCERHRPTEVHGSLDGPERFL